VSALSDMSTSWLAQAQATDLELYEATKDRPRRETDPLLVEETLVVSLLKGIHELLQQNTHYTAAASPKGTKRPKVKRLPRPKTAEQMWARQEARRAHEHVESVLVFVPEDQWKRTHGGG
jgi:hypothetical protein